MKKNYVSPELAIITLEASDIIVTSGDCGEYVPAANLYGSNPGEESKTFNVGSQDVSQVNNITN